VTKPGRRWLLAVAAAGLLVVAIAGGVIVPLYDGVGFPDEPYRYLGKTPLTTAQPQPVEQTVPSSTLASNTVMLQSTEFGPQVAVNFTAGAITLPAGASEVHLSAIPEAASGAPASGSIAGNLYQITLSSTPGSPRIKNNLAGILLRLPQDATFRLPPVMEYRTADGQWKALNTVQTGADIYQAQFAGPGEYTLVINANGATTNRSAAKPPAAHSTDWLLIGLGGGILLALVMVIRVLGSGLNDSKRQ
jgi:hypothetical protein